MYYMISSLKNFAGDKLKLTQNIKVYASYDKYLS